MMPSLIQKALILVAGPGSRLAPLTYTLPKCMIEVNGIPILVNTLNHLAAKGFMEAVIVIGHMDALIEKEIGNKFKTMDIVYIRNNLFHETNNMYSLWLAREHLRDENGVILIEGDLFFEKAVLTRLMNTDNNSYWAVDQFILFKEGCMLTTDKTGEIESIEIIRHTLSTYTCNQHKSAGMLKITPDMGHIFSDCLDFEVRHWHLNLYYDQVLSRHLPEFDLCTCTISGLKWMEIDDIHDLKKAESIFLQPHEFLDF